MTKGTVSFLGYEIHNSGNSDGWVLSKPDTHDWRCHMGNYSSITSAKEWAVRFFMIERPQHFAHQIAFRMIGTQAYHDFYKFTSVLQEEGIEIPEEIGCTDMNFTLTFRGKKV